MRAELSVNRKPKEKAGVKGTKSISTATRLGPTAQKAKNPKSKTSVIEKPTQAKPKTKAKVLAKPAKPSKNSVSKAAQVKTTGGKSTKKLLDKASAKVKVTPQQTAKKPLPSKKTSGDGKGKHRAAVKTTFATIVSAPPIPPELPRRQFSTGAMRAFDQAIKVFNRRQFEDAKPMFEALLSKFQSDVEIVARSQMYIQVCNQKMVNGPATPRSADEFYDRGVFALNIGDFSQARNFFEKALRLKPDEPHLLYSLAATHAQSGAHDQALDYLKRSIQVQPRLRAQAFNDSDFSGLRENKRFLELIGLASPFDLLESRR